MGRRSMALTAALLLLCVSCASSPEHTWDSARVQAVLSADGTAAQAAPRSAEASVYTFPVLTGTTMLDSEPVTWTSRAQLEYRLSGAPSSGGLVQVRLQIVACTATYRGVTRPVSETPITYSGLTLAVGMGEHTAISRVALDSNAAPDDVSGVVRVLSYTQLSCPSDRRAVCALRVLEGQTDASFHGGALLPLDTAGCLIAADDTCTLSGVGDCLTLELLVSYHDNGVPAPPQSCRTAGAVWASARAALDSQPLGTLAMPVRQAPYTAWRLR